MRLSRFLDDEGIRGISNGKTSRDKGAMFDSVNKSTGTCTDRRTLRGKGRGPQSQNKGPRMGYRKKKNRMRK